MSKPTTVTSTRRRSTRLVATAVALIAGGSLAAAATRADAHGPIATATLRDANGDVVGRVRFANISDHTVVQVQLGANAHVTTNQFHGFHIHAGTDATTGASGCIADAAKPATSWFVSAGGHLKVDGQNHANHTGDLQSLLVNADGSASSSFTTARFAPADLYGKAIILHAGADNFGNVPAGAAPDQYSANSPAASTKTQNTGNAGDRVACGVIHSPNQSDR